VEDGSLTAQQVAAKKVKELLNDHQTPELDSAKEEELQAFITRRKSEITP